MISDDLNPDDLNSPYIPTVLDQVRPAVRQASASLAAWTGTGDGPVVMDVVAGG